MSRVATPERAFDFWVGEWALESRSRVDYERDEWTTGPASNRISRILDGRALLEEFDGRPAEEFRGTSLTAWDGSTWRQVWVDTSGNWMEFTGGATGDEVILSRPAVVRDRPAIQRMVFDRIETDAFRWRWQVSWDDGGEWLLLWEILYRRR